MKCDICKDYNNVKRYKIHLSARSINSKRSKRMNLCKEHKDCIDFQYFVERGFRYNAMSYKLRNKKPVMCLLEWTKDEYEKLTKLGIKVC